MSCIKQMCIRDRRYGEKGESGMYKEFINDNYEVLLEVLNCLKVGVYITDGQGNTLFLNDESCKTGGTQEK